MKKFAYSGDRTREISFPLGGIGSGCIGLSGSGRLVDWEIFNRPNKGGLNGCSHFAIKAESTDGVIDARVLNSDIRPPYSGEHSGSHFNSFGFGTHRHTMAGVPHFRDLDFSGCFPIAELKFKDDEFPGDITMEAFNPLIPNDDRNSSLPAAFFGIRVKNDTRQTVTYTVEGSLAVPAEDGEWQNRYSERAVGRAGSDTSRYQTSVICSRTGSFGSEDPKFGDMTLAVVQDDGEVSHQEYWFRGNWYDGLQMFWKDFIQPGPLKNRVYGKLNNSRFPDTATLALTKTIAPGDEKEFRFIISWNFPNCCNYWSERCDCDGDCCGTTNSQPRVWKNYYAESFRDSVESAEYGIAEWDQLYTRTRRFQETLYSSTVPEPVLDAIGANISILKSPTCLRLTDGSFYGFEGCHCDSGCCEGSCSHVWNYAYALPYLFPKLERSMRDLDFTHNQREDGRMSFRLQLPLGTAREEFRACVDGQMGGVIKAYREWKICGDDEWLQKNWPAIKRSIEFAWAPTNEDKWDPDKTGVITGRQHHTLDMELFGPNSWLTGFYLAALKAGALMARHLGDRVADEYERLFEKGKQWTEQHLYNGRYFIQHIDLADEMILRQFEQGDKSLFGEGVFDAYWDAEHGEIKYQVGQGCIIDQVLAQWHANLIGLGEILDPQKVKSALSVIYANNFKSNVRGHFNPCRLFCLNDEGGTVICEWPEGAYKPHVPIPYSEETMHGFEYQVATHMIQEGMVDQGMKLVKAVRDRYDGSTRNPWNEIECGSNYARSMASYALLLTFSGFQVDMGRKQLRFNPIPWQDKESGFHVVSRFFWSVDGAWGEIEITDQQVRLSVQEGRLVLAELVFPFLEDRKLERTELESNVVPAEMASGIVVFSPAVVVDAGCAVTLAVEP